MKTYTLNWVKIQPVANNNTNVAHDIVLGDMSQNLKIGLDHQKILNSIFSQKVYAYAFKINGVLATVVKYLIFSSEEDRRMHVNNHPNKKEPVFKLVYDYTENNFYKEVPYDSKEWMDEVKEYDLKQKEEKKVKTQFNDLLSGKNFGTHKIVWISLESIPSEFQPFFRVEYRFNKDSHPILKDSNTTPGVSTYFNFYVSDIQEVVNRLEQIAKLPNFDVLTGLCSEVDVTLTGIKPIKYRNLK